MTELRVALVSGSPLVLAGLRAGLTRVAGVNVVHESRTLEAARQAGFAQADVAVVDTEPGAATFELVEGPPLVLLADDGDRHLGDWLMSGFTVLARHASIDAIAAAASAAAAGLVATTPKMAAQALRLARIGGRSVAAPALERLTTREHEVLAKMSLGMGNREIAGVLHISQHTAKFGSASV